MIVFRTQRSSKVVIVSVFVSVIIYLIILLNSSAIKNAMRAIQLGDSDKNGDTRTILQNKPDVINNNAEDMSNHAGVPIDNYLEYPCLIGENQFKIEDGVNITKRCVRQFAVKETDATRNINLSDCFEFRSPFGKAFICTFDGKTDKYVSGAARKKNQQRWEERMIQNLENYSLKKEFDFLDIGCNIGTYLIALAKAGKRVVGVDPIIDNLNLVSKSLQLSNLDVNVTLIWNALSDVYNDVTLSFEQGNVGATKIRNIIKSDLSSVFRVGTVRLDDLIPLFKGKRVVIKMDVEESELHALLGGIRFFNEITVLLVQMKFVHHRKKPSGMEIIDFMTVRNFEAFKDIDGTHKLNAKLSTSWPFDVYFIKRK